MTNSVGTLNKKHKEMKHLKTFEGYLNEVAQEKSNPLSESKEIYVSDAKFKDEAALKADIMKNMGPAINKLLKDNGITYGPITVAEGSGRNARYEFESKPIMGEDLGIMKYGFKEVYIDTFGGGSIPHINKDADGFEFSPYIWFELHYSYTHGSADTTSQGSNGCSLYLPGEKRSDIYYDIVNGVFLKSAEFLKINYLGAFR